MIAPENQRSIDRLPPAYRLYRWAWAGLDWLYPPYCGGCGKPGTRWCQNCQASVTQIDPPVCTCCGKKWPQDVLCTDCRKHVRSYQAVRSWASYSGPLRAAIHRLKYSGSLTLGDILAHPLLLLLHKLAWQIDIVVPVPMTTPHRSKRGYNQAALLAWPVALGSHNKYCPEALVKIRFSRSQVGLTHEERYQNVAGAFLANPRLVAGRSILVVDDVMTSGATMQACAATLIEAGAASVFGLTLARAGTVADHNSTGWLDPERQAAAEPGKRF